jgi:hypothetical protein
MKNGKKISQSNNKLKGTWIEGVFQIIDVAPRLFSNISSCMDIGKQSVGGFI